MLSLKLLIVTFLICSVTGIRLCTPGSDKKKLCLQMQADLAIYSDTVHCIPARDRYECLEFLVKNYVDVALADPEDALVSQQEFGSKLSVLGYTVDKDKTGDPYRYQAVAVIRKSTIRSLSDLKGSKSCHTGYRKTSGWFIPISQLISKNILATPCEDNFKLSVVEQDLKAVEAHFGSACLPGEWSSDREINRALKQKYSSLCSLCSNPTLCDDEDQRAGYQGALKCLQESSADVAWTKLSTAQKFFDENPTANEEYGYLCSDGTISSSSKPCFWGARPWKLWLVASDNSHKQQIGKTLKMVLENLSREAYMSKLFGANKDSVFVDAAAKYSTKEYVQHHREYMNTITEEVCTNPPIRLCVKSKAALRKCHIMKVMFSSRRIRPSLECVLVEEDSSCLSFVKEGKADITVASSKEFYDGYKEYNLDPVLSEKYGLLPLSYYAVAVIKANSTIRSIEDLRSMKSCHTGSGRTAGWVVPISTLLEHELMEPRCDFPKALSNFFSKSCIPGIKDDDKNNMIPESLCGLCPRQSVSIYNTDKEISYAFDDIRDDRRCTKTDEEPFYGYSGAFRCLVEGGGDVAFVKHTTIGENSNGNSIEEWSRSLHSKDFKLLCPEGGTADPIDFAKCYWARVPSRKVLAGRHLLPYQKENIKILLTHALDKFPANQDVLALFGTFQSRHNLIFGDETTQFLNIDYTTSVGEIETEFFEKMEYIRTCESSATSPVSSIGILSFLIAYVAL